MKQSKKSEPILTASFDNKMEMAKFSSGKLRSKNQSLRVFSAIVMGFDFLFLLFTSLFMPSVGFTITTSFLLIADVLFFLIVISSNQRTRYFKKYFFIFLGIYAVFNYLTIAFTSSIFNQTFSMDFVSSALFVIAKCLVLIGFFVNLLKVSKEKPLIMNSVVGLIFALSFALLIGFSVNNFGIKGSSTSLSRVVSYKANTDGTLTAVNVLPGLGGNVYIPEEVNGQKVKSVDVRIFTHDLVSTVEFESPEPLNFVNESNVKSINDRIQIKVENAIANEVRDWLYVNKGYRSLDIYDQIIPNVHGDEVFVNILYSETAELPKEFGNKLLPIWIGHKGDTLNMNYFSTLNTYNEHKNDLQYSFDNLDKSRITSLDLDTEQIVNESREVILDMERIYKIYRTTPYLYNGDFGEDIVYATKSDLSQLNLDLERPGCSISWSKDTKRFRTDGSSIIEYMKASNLTELEISASWAINDFTEFSLSAGSESYTYGENIVVNYNMVNALPTSLSLYGHGIWQDVSNSTSCSFGLLSPGEHSFLMNALVTDPVDPNIKLEKSINLSITVGKKDISVTWPTQKEYIYNGYTQTIDCSFDDSQLVGDDVLVPTFSEIEFKNASDFYKAKAAFIGTSLEYYNVTNDSFDYECNPKKISVSFSSSTGEPMNNLVYNKEQKTINPAFTGYVGLDFFNGDITGNVGTDAGTYSIEIDLENNNYELEGPTAYEWQIKPKSITFVWPNVTLYYNGLIQNPDPIYTLISGDYLGLSVNGGQASVGHYTATSTYANKNYYVTNPNVEFDIVVAHVQVQWENTTFEYDGSDHFADLKPYVMISGEKVYLLCETIALVEVGEYQVTATSSYYELESATITVTIEEGE